MLGPVGAAVNAARGRWGLRALLWAVVLLATALVLDWLPLFDVLGYDFSFALGMVTAFAAADVGHGVGKRRAGSFSGPSQRPGDQDWRGVLRPFGEACAVAVALLVLPLAASLANALRVRNCNLGAGFGFFFLLPVMTALYAACAGVLAARVPGRRGRVLAFAIPVVSLIWTLLRLYREPAVFAFDPFGGYFPGPIDDEALRPPAALVWFRAACVVWMATAVAIAVAAAARGFDPRRWRRRALVLALPLVAGSIAFYTSGGSLGFRVGRADLKRALDRTLTTEHFVVHYARGSKTPAELALAAEDSEFRYHQLRETFGLEPKLPITVWEFPNADAKKQLVGAGGTLYARPWTQEIFMHGTRFPSNRLRHEMAHVFAGAFGDPLFGISLAWRRTGFLPLPKLASGLVEGIAEAADSSDPDGDATIHEEARAMIEAGLAPPLAAVVGSGFTTLAGRRAYTMAGSFSAFLLATRGSQKLRDLYRSAGNFTDVYRVPLADLEREWREFLARQPLTTRERARASEDFRRPAIFARVCARELAARLAEARAIQRDDPARAVAILERTCSDDPGEPIYRLALAEALALAGARERALTMLGQLAVGSDITVPLRAQAASLAAEINFIAGDITRADSDQRRATELASSEAERRLALAKLRALDSESARATLGRALYGDELQGAGADPVLTFYLMGEYARLFPADMLGPYLLGRQLLQRDPARALPYLARACESASAAPSPGAASGLPAEFVRECRRMIADAGYRIGDFARARTALERLAADATGEAERLRALDMRARVDWAASLRSGPPVPPVTGRMGYP